MRDQSKSIGSFKRRRLASSALLIFVSVVGTCDVSFAFSQINAKKPPVRSGRRKLKAAAPKGKRIRAVSSVRVVASPFEAAVLPSSRRKSDPRITLSPTSNSADGPYVVNLPASSRAVTVRGKRNKSTKMARPKSMTSSPRLDTRTTLPKKEFRERLLTREEEGILTHRVRSLRRAVRIRDDLAEKSEGIPSENDWALACNLSAIGLRKVMYEGQQARTRLVDANVGLVRSIAKRYHQAVRYATEAGNGVGTILGLQDLIQEGNLGLMQAAERFERERGLRFSTYATYWIKQRILQSISDSSRVIRLPAHVHSMLQKVKKARRAMTQSIGRQPSIPELAHYMELSVDELTKITSRSLNAVSLERPIRLGGSIKEDRRTIGDFIVSDAPTPEENVQRQWLVNDIRSVINELAENERDVLVLRFGLDHVEPMTVRQVAKKLSLSSDSVRLIEARALNKLRNPLRNYKLKHYVRGDVAEEEPMPKRDEQEAEGSEDSSQKLWFF